MDSTSSEPREQTSQDRWERPAFEVICLACEISAYVPDEGEPLF
jgi:coenzyme PQQ precursor peptide PqqA